MITEKVYTLYKPFGGRLWGREKIQWFLFFYIFIDCKEMHFPLLIVQFSSTYKLSKECCLLKLNILIPWVLPCRSYAWAHITDWPPLCLELQELLFFMLDFTDRLTQKSSTAVRTSSESIKGSSDKTLGKCSSWRGWLVTGTGSPVVMATKSVRVQEESERCHMV